MHCGSFYGLTPPGWYSRQSPHHLKLQKESWQAYKKIATKWNAPDILVCNGDLIDGRQKKDGGMELITPDRNLQKQMAIKAIQEFDAKEVYMTYGSDYHVSEGEDWEYDIADRLNAKIEGKLFLDIEGMVFDIRHYVGSSFTYQSRGTSLLREMMWDLVKSADGEPRANVVVRSHVHYHIWVEQPNRVCFTTPALQLARGRYGSRKCTGEVHWGAVRLTVGNGEIKGRDIEICRLRANRPRVFRIG